MGVMGRPRGVAVAALLLVVSGLLAGVGGLLLSWVSSCCGSPDPPDGTPVLVGLVTAAGLVAAGVMLWCGGVSSTAVLALASVGPVVSGVAAAGSSDFQALLPFTVLGWVALWWLVRRPRARAWLVQ